MILFDNATKIMQKILNLCHAGAFFREKLEAAKKDSLQ